MDHGVLNVLLSKRGGDSDKRIDRSKNEQARAREASAKASRAAFRVERANAIDEHRLYVHGDQVMVSRT